MEEDGFEREDNMFGKGDFIVYGSTGVCEVKDVTTLDMKEVSKDRLYYILRPVREKESKIFAPVDGNKTVLCAVLTREEAESLIDDIPTIEELWISSDKLREEKYKETIRSCECRDWIRIIKTLYLRGQERQAQGKRATAMDEKYLRLAKDNLYSELSLALDIPKEEMEGFIADRIHETELCR